jgi:hypothetical protein
MCEFFGLSVELYFKLKNYERAEELLNKLLANVEDGCLLQENLKSAKTLMLCLRASLLLSKVQNIQRKQGSTTQVSMYNHLTILLHSQASACLAGAKSANLFVLWRKQSCMK